LYYESKIGSHALGQDFIKMVESDIVKEHSIGFNIVNERKSESGNELLDIKLFEGSSLTAWGANEYTPLVGMKSIDIQARVDRLKKLEKFVKSTDASDDTIELLLLEIKQLNQLIESLTSTAAAVNAPAEQKGEDVSAVSDAFDILLYRHFK
jgi:hypothetical protein